jgi:flavorubredoxin
MITEIKKGVYWVGVVDWELRHFHGHELTTERGSTYNAYLIVDEKVALIDSVWSPYSAQLMAKIREIIDPARIDYVIANHAEVDHAGSMAEVMKHCPNATMYCSKNGAAILEGNYHQGWKCQTVKTGDTLSLGKNELTFIEAPLLHWPDSMFTFAKGCNILFSNDAFGQHYSTSARFNDEVDTHELYEEALKYYACILCPYSDRVIKKIDEIIPMNLPIEMIAPSHGILWRKDPLQIVHKYREWAQQQGEPKAVIVYDTMWEATRKMAEAISEGLTAAGVEHKLYNASTGDRNEIITEIFKAKTVLFGSSTINNGLLPHILPILNDVKGLRIKHKQVACFGSYGWSGETVKILEEYVQSCGLTLIQPGLRCKWQPDAAALEACRGFGRRAGEATR